MLSLVMVAFWLACKATMSLKARRIITSVFLGSGMRIAALTKRQDILAALDYALEQIKRKGDLERLYFRYFPRDFYS